MTKRARLEDRAVPPSVDTASCEDVTGSGLQAQAGACHRSPSDGGRADADGTTAGTRDGDYLPQGPRQPNEPCRPEFAKFDALILRFMEEHDVPGLSVAVSKDGDLIYTQCYGWASHSVPLRPHHTFRIASISKVLTAVGTLRLYQDGRLRLSDRVFGAKGLLPEYTPAPQGDRRTLRITVRHLLQHSGGWDRDVAGDPTFYTHVGAEMGAPEPVSNDVLIRYMMAQKLQFTPGTKYVYSNFGYMLLGRVIARVSGRSYESYIQSLLREVHITNVHLGRSLREEKHQDEVEYFASPAYRRVPSVFPGGGEVSAPYGGYCMETGDADGGWVAAPTDLVKLLNALDGRQQQGILTRDTFRQMTARPVYARGSPCWYGLGLDVSWSRRAWEHGGHIDGATGTVTRSRDPLTWAVLANYWPRDSDYTSLLAYGLSTISGLTKTRNVRMELADAATCDRKHLVNVKMTMEEFDTRRIAFEKLGYRVQWFNGYQMSGRLFCNVIWVKDDVVSKFYCGLTLEEVEQIVETESGYCVDHVDTYFKIDGLRFALILIEQDSVYHFIPNLNLIDLDAKVKLYSDENCQLKCCSPYFIANEGFSAALFVPSHPNNKSWYKTDLDIDQYAKESSRQSRYGHLQTYLKSYHDNDNDIRFSAIWGHPGAFVYTSEHDMSPYRLLHDVLVVAQQGFHPACVCGYEDEGTHKYAAVCVKQSEAK